MNVMMKIKSDLYAEPDNKGRQKIIKKGIITRANIPLEQVGTIMEIFNTKGKLIKNECKIYLPEIGFMTVNHSFDYVKDLKDSISNTGKKIGF